MFGIQINKSIEDLLRDQDRKIPQDHLKEVCKIRKGEKACRYIMLGEKGFMCAKRTKIKDAIDIMCAKGQMTAKGNNCKGLGEEQK
jgi:CTP-dependent riboflavin kinase